MIILVILKPGNIWWFTFIANGGAKGELYFDEATRPFPGDALYRSDQEQRKAWLKSKLCPSLRSETNPSVDGEETSPQD